MGVWEKGMAVWSVLNGHPLFRMPRPIQAIALAKQLIVSNPYFFDPWVVGSRLGEAMLDYVPEGGGALIIAFTTS